MTITNEKLRWRKVKYVCLTLHLLCASYLQLLAFLKTWHAQAKNDIDGYLGNIMPQIACTPICPSKSHIDSTASLNNHASHFKYSSYFMKVQKPVWEEEFTATERKSESVLDAFEIKCSSEVIVITPTTHKSFSQVTLPETSGYMQEDRSGISRRFLSV